MSKSERMAERYAAYCDYRDQGDSPEQAIGKLGLSETTKGNYERAYRRARELAPRPWRAFPKDWHG
jgi:hypothetical protein